DLVKPQFGGDEAKLGTEGGEKSGIERGNCTGSSDSRLSSVENNIVASVRIGVSGHIRYHPSRPVWRPHLPIGQRLEQGRVSAACPFTTGITRIVVPHSLCRCSLSRATAANYMWSRRGKIDIGRVRSAIT